jgi:hypothetical protein
MSETKRYYYLKANDLISFGEGRWVWPERAKFLPVTKAKIFDDDIPLYAEPRYAQLAPTCPHPERHKTSRYIPCQDCDYRAAQSAPPAPESIR